jgi:hypothetical protein
MYANKRRSTACAIRAWMDRIRSAERSALRGRRTLSASQD